MIKRENPNINNEEKMRFFSLLLCIFMLSVFSYARPHLILDKHAQKFLKERRSIHGHRLGYETHGVKKMADKAFVVEIDSTDGMLSVLKYSLKKKFDIKEDGNRSLKLKNEKFRIDVNGWDKDEKKFGEILVKKLFPEFISNQFDLVSVDDQIEVNLSTNETELIGRVFHYQRIFNDRIVRSEDDELTISVESDGHLNWAQISMSDLRLTSEYVETIESAEENEASLDTVINASFSTMRNMKTQKNVAVRSVTASGAAEAYCRIEDENKSKLFPCISYTSDLSLEDGSSITTIIDAPHSHKLLKEFKNGKKHRMHFANGSMGHYMFVFGR